MTTIIELVLIFMVCLFGTLFLGEFFFSHDKLNIVIFLLSYIGFKFFQKNL